MKWLSNIKKINVIIYSRLNNIFLLKTHLRISLSNNQKTLLDAIELKNFCQSFKTVKNIFQNLMT